MIWFVLRQRFTPMTLAALLFVIPFPFYIAALYGGQAIIWEPGATPPGSHIYMYTVRYVAQMVGPPALFVATLVDRLSRIARGRFAVLRRVGLLCVSLAPSLLIT